MPEANVLPNSLAYRHTHVVLGGVGQFRTLWVPIYCANCGAEGGRVPEENCKFAFWLCENCFQTHGKIAGTMSMPDEVFWAKFAEDRKAKEL